MEIDLTGPYFRFSSPYGVATLERDEWFVSQANGGPCMGTITRFHSNRRQYVAVVANKIARSKTLKGAIACAVELWEKEKADGN